jgi:hypothetical protein
MKSIISKIPTVLIIYIYTTLVIKTGQDRNKEAIFIFLLSLAGRKKEEKKLTYTLYSEGSMDSCLNFFLPVP